MASTPRATHRIHPKSDNLLAARRPSRQPRVQSGRPRLEQPAGRAVTVWQGSRRKPLRPGRTRSPSSAALPTRPGRRPLRLRITSLPSSAITTPRPSPRPPAGSRLPRTGPTRPRPSVTRSATPPRMARSSAFRVRSRRGTTATAAGESMQTAAPPAPAARPAPASRPAPSSGGGGGHAGGGGGGGSPSRH